MNGLFICHFAAYVGLAVYLDDSVAWQYAYLLRRTVLDDVGDIDSVVLYHELNPNAGERTVQVVVGGLGVFGGDVGRVGVKVFQDEGDGVIHNFLHVDGVDIFIVDDVEQLCKFVG